MKLIALLFRASRRITLAAVLCGVLSGVGSTVLVALINQALEQGDAPQVRLIVTFTAVGLLALGVRIAAQVLLNHLHHGALFDLRLNLCLRILSSPLRRLEENGSHLLLGALMESVIAISNGLTVLPFIFVNIAIVCACISYLAWLSLPTFLAMMVFMALAMGTFWIFALRGLRLLERGRDVQGSLFNHFRSLVEGTKELKLHRRRRGAFVRELLRPTANELRRLMRGGDNMYSISSSWGMLLFFAFIGLLLFALRRYLHMSGATMMGYTLATLYLQQPLQLIMDYVPTLTQGELALEKLQELGLALATGPTEQGEPPHDQAEPRPTFTRLELRGVTHLYHREQEPGGFTLGPIDLTLKQGELVFLVGGNGSGKTTLAKLLTGLYVPESGEIRLDGRLVTDENREEYRQLFSAIFSDFHLFERLLGVANTESEPQVKAYLSRLQLDRKVQIHDGALSTTALSQGQRKRLALLTAYLEDRPIYLFDEWAADQDPIFKDIFYRELLPELKARGKTVLVITHDDRYFHLADRALRLDQGKLSSPPVASAAAPEHVVA